MFRNIAIMLLLITATVAADAQQRATLQTRTATHDSSFTPEFQQAMESGNYQQAAALVSSGRATGRRQHTPATSGPMRLSSGEPETAEYTCNSGNCACAGASDCVAMAPICEEGTIGCNDYGCTCHEASD